MLGDSTSFPILMWPLRLIGMRDAVRSFLGTMLGLEIPVPTTYGFLQSSIHYGNQTAMFFRDGLTPHDNTLYQHIFIGKLDVETAQKLLRKHNEFMERNNTSGNTNATKTVTK